MAFVDYKRDLKNPAIDLDYVMDRYYHSGTPHVFAGANPDEEARLKQAVSREIYASFGARVHSYQLVVCGSAHLGFCPVPGERFGRPFDADRSDIDIAVVSPDLFERCWVEVQDAHPDQDTREILSRDLFWGIINPANVSTVCDFGRKWWALFGRLETDRAQGVRGRLYRSYWSMQNYHRLAVIRARRELQTEPEAPGA